VIDDVSAAQDYEAPTLCLKGVMSPSLSPGTGHPHMHRWRNPGSPWAIALLTDLFFALA